MSLKDILEKLIQAKTPILLSDSSKDWEASALLENLPEPKLKTEAYLQPGLYIAEISGSGYLGRVLYKVKQKI